MSTPSGGTPTPYVVDQAEADRVLAWFRENLASEALRSAASAAILDESLSNGGPIPTAWQRGDVVALRAALERSEVLAASGDTAGTLTALEEAFELSLARWPELS